MFEINFNGQEILDYYKNERKAYKDGEYDFTFENRFLIYHSVRQESHWDRQRCSLL